MVNILIKIVPEEKGEGHIVLVMRLTLPGHLSSISVLVGFVMLNHKCIMFKWIIVFVLFL
jgi:hypothetical protein